MVMGVPNFVSRIRILEVMVVDLFLEVQATVVEMCSCVMAQRIVQSGCVAVSFYNGTIDPEQISHHENIDRWLRTKCSTNLALLAQLTATGF